MGVGAKGRGAGVVRGGSGLAVVLRRGVGAEPIGDAGLCAQQVAWRDQGRGKQTPDERQRTRLMLPVDAAGPRMRDAAQEQDAASVLRERQGMGERHRTGPGMRNHNRLLQP